MEHKKETLTEQHKKALDYEKNQLPIDFKNAVEKRDAKAVIALILRYPSSYLFKINDAVLVMGSIESQDEVIEFLDLLWNHPNFATCCFSKLLQNAIDIAVINYQPAVVTFLLKKQFNYLLEHNPLFDINPTLLTSIQLSESETKKPVRRRKPDSYHMTNPEYHAFLDGLVSSLLKEDPRLLNPYKQELVVHYQNRKENTNPDILLLLLEHLYFSIDNPLKITRVGMLPWAVKNGHAKIVRLFYRDEAIPRYYINEAISTAHKKKQTSILALLALEKFWPILRIFLMPETTVLTDDIKKDIVVQYFLSPTYQNDLYFFTKENTIEISPSESLNLIIGFLKNETTRLKSAYKITNGTNSFIQMMGRQGCTSDGYGNWNTDYIKPMQLQYIKHYIEKQLATLTCKDIPILIAFIHAVCSVKKHLVSSTPTSLNNFIAFCHSNRFDYPKETLLSGEKLLELFKTDNDVPKVIDEIRKAHDGVLESNESLTP